MKEKTGVSKTTENYKQDAHLWGGRCLFRLLGTPVPLFRVGKCPASFFIYMIKESSKEGILKFDFSEIFYHKELIENKIFTQKEAREMFDILAEIHSALKDKKTNTGRHKIGVIELMWFRCIDELINQMKEPVPI